MGIIGVMWLIGVINLLTESHDPPSDQSDRSRPGSCSIMTEVFLFLLPQNAVKHLSRLLAILKHRTTDGNSGKAKDYVIAFRHVFVTSSNP